jgi:hypothetical protein
VKLTGDQTVAGNKTFTNNVVHKGSGNQSFLLTGGYAYCSNTGGVGSTDKYIEMFHDGTNSGLAVNNGNNSWAMAVGVTEALKQAGIIQVWGKNSPIVWAFWSGSSSAVGSGAAYNCSATYLSAGRVRIWLTTAFAYATHALLVSGTYASNGTNWCVPQILGNAGDGSYVDIGLVPTGAGTGTAIEGQLGLLVLKVR